MLLYAIISANHYKDLKLKHKWDKMKILVMFNQKTWQQFGNKKLDSQKNMDN